MFHGPLWASRLRPEHQFARWGARCFSSHERNLCGVYLSGPLSSVAGFVCLLHSFMAYRTTNRIVPFMGVWPEPGESMRFVCVLAVLRIVCAPNIPPSMWFFYKTCACNPINQSMAHMHVSPGLTHTRFEPAVGWMGLPD